MIIHANQVGRALGLAGIQTFPRLYETPVIGREIARNSMGNPTPNPIEMFLNSLMRWKSATILSAVHMDLNNTITSTSALLFIAA